MQLKITILRLRKPELSDDLTIAQLQRFTCCIKAKCALKSKLTSMKGHDSPLCCQFAKNHLHLAISMHIQNLIKFCPFVLKILSGNKILTSIKGHNYFTNLQKMTGNKPNLDLLNMNVYINLVKFFQICSQYIKLKRNSDINQGP